jgi:hypothetical protein
MPGLLRAVLLTRASNPRKLLSMTGTRGTGIAASAAHMRKAMGAVPGPIEREEERSR